MSVSNCSFQYCLQRCILFALCAIAGIAAAKNLHGAESGQVKRVLILHSFGRDFAPFNATSSGFRTELARQSAAPIEFLEASLETARFGEGGSEIPFVDYLRALFADRPPHLLVPFGAPAMNFLLRNRAKLFPGVPLLVGTADKRRLSGVNLGANATAVGTSLDLPGIIENILQVLPSTTNIEVVIGNSPLEKFWLAELRRDFQRFTDRLRFSWLNELSFEEMRRRVAMLPRDSAILYALLLVDAAGVPHEQDRALQVLHRDSNAPIFGAFDSQFGHGIVGGPLYPTQEVSRQAAQLAVRILNGDSPASIQPVLLDSATPTYDWRELKRWGIDENRLPAASIVQFREPTLWEQYRWYIIAALAIVTLQTAIIVNLLLHRARRRRAEANLRDSEENLRRLVETTAAVPWQADAQSWEFTYVGPQAVKFFGYPLEQWYQKDFWVSHLHPDDKELAINTCLSNSARTSDFAFEYRMIASSGKSVWVHDIVHCEQRDGKPIALRGFMLDISERKQAEQALRESEERMSLAANAANLGLWTWDVVSDKVWVTPEARRFFGWEKADSINFARFIETLHPDDREPTRQAVIRSLDRGDDYSAEYRIVVRDGAIRWVAARGRVELDGNSKPIRMRGVAIDITDRKQAEESLEKERRFLRQVIDIDPNFIFAKDREGRFTLVNQSVADAYGTTVEDLLGKTDADFNPNRQEVEFFRQMDREVMDTLRERFIPEEHVTNAQGKVRWLQTVKRPIFDKDGSANQVLGSSTDITQRKQAESELQRNRQELAHVTRISTMGELAASLAHELNQPLTAILSNAQAAQRFLAADPADLAEVREILKDIVQDDNRASEVIQRLRAMVKKEELAFTPLDIAGVVRDVVALVYSDAILHGVRILLELDTDLPAVRGDKVQLQQVVLNLMLNTFDAMNDCPGSDREVEVQAALDGWSR